MDIGITLSLWYNRYITSTINILKIDRAWNFSHKYKACRDSI